MSRSYQISISVNKHNPDRHQDIVEAVLGLEYEGDADRYDVGKRSESIQFHSEVISVRAGQTECEVALEIHEAVWKANQGFCEVNVGLLCLEDSEVYTGGRDAYDKLHPEQAVARHNIEVGYAGMVAYYGLFANLDEAGDWIKPMPSHDSTWDSILLSDVPRGKTILDPSSYRRRKDPNLPT